MTAALIVLGFLLGISLGSFLNVVIDRVPAGQSLLRPPSHCPSCRKRIPPADLIPVFSYLRLRGRCRYCGSPIPARVLIVELLSGAILTGSILAFGATPQAAFISFFSLALLCLSVIDIESGIVPGAILAPLTAIAIPASLLYPALGWRSAGLGAAIYFLILFLPALARRDAIGWGDIKLAPLLGLITGYPSVLVALLASFVSGGVFSAALLLRGRASRKTPIPFVPFLAVGTITAIAVGPGIVAWYLSLFQPA